MYSFKSDELGCHKLLSTVIRQVTSTRDQFMLGADLNLRLPCFIFVRGSNSCGCAFCQEAINVCVDKQHAEILHGSTYSDMLQAHVVAILIPLTDCMIAQTAYVYQCI